MPPLTVARRRTTRFLASIGRRSVVLMLALVLTSTIGIQSSDTATAATGTSVVTGIVTGSDGAPAVGIRVSLRPEVGSSRHVDTDESGAYQFVSYVGRYTLLFQCWTSCVGNYIPEFWDDQIDAMTWFDLVEGGRIHLETELELAGEISGVVRGDDGTPLPGIDVDITSNTAGVVPPAYFPTTDDEGRYRFRNLPEGGYTLRFRPPTAFAHEYFSEYWEDQTQADAADVIHVTAGESVSGIDPRLTPAAWISGRVVNEDGVPLGRDADVNIFLYRVTDAGTSWIDTGSLGNYPVGPGEFRFDGLTSGTYVLRTRSLGYGLAEWWDDQPDLASANRIVLDAGERFDGKIVLEGGPVSLTGPQISGVARVGETLSAAASSPTPSVSLAFQWFADDVPIDGATEPTRTLTAAELGAGITVEVVASAPGRIPVTRRSGMNSDVQPAVLTSAMPKIMGERLVGSTLTADTGVWTDGTVFTYQWRANGSAISGADDAELLLTPSHAGKQISVAVTGSKPGFASATQISGWVNVSYGPAALTTPVILGTPEVGSTLTASASSTTPGAKFSYDWFKNGVQILSEDDQTIVLREEHAGWKISVVVFVSAPDYIPVHKASSATAPVARASWGEVTRLAGPNRYETSALISASQFEPGVPVAYIASGTNFPDALAGAPVAGITGGPMLLTNPNTLPDSVTAELERLQPERIVILGGTGTISATVEARLRDLHPGAVTRLAGPNRYETSALISASQFEPGVPVAYIASGTNFPDALAGAPVAGITGGPMLLTNPNTLPDSVTAELERLQPERIVILGGTPSISASVAQQLDAYTTGSLTRLSGADRYATSVAISKANFDVDVPVAYIANGTNFPDALSGAPVAAIQGGPVLLTPAGWLPSAVHKELQRLRPKRIVILGGPGSVSSSVQIQLENLG